MARPGTFDKGHAKLGGRTKGVPNKDSQEAKERLQQLLGETIRFTPLQIMYAVMQIKLVKGDPPDGPCPAHQLIVLTWASHHHPAHTEGAEHDRTNAWQHVHKRLIVPTAGRRPAPSAAGAIGSLLTPPGCSEPRPAPGPRRHSAQDFLIHVAYAHLRLVE